MTDRASGGSDSVHLLPDEARTLGLSALLGIGCDAEDASVILDQLIDNSLSGYGHAGLPRILAIDGEPRFRMPKRKPTITRSGPSSALIDAGNTIGYVAALHAADIAIEKASKTGMATVAVSNSWFSGRNAYFVERIAAANLVAFHTVSSKARVAPFGGAAPALGANPISFGFPSEDGPVVVDMSTASIAWGDLLMMADRDEPLPEGIALDADGNPTRDAAAASAGAILPFGGHKGYALSFAIQALGLLAAPPRDLDQPDDYAFFFAVWDPEMTGPLADFKRRMSELVRSVKQTARQPGVTEILVPSERAFRERARRRDEGFHLDRAAYERLSRLAARS